MIFCDFFMNLSNISPETTTDLSTTARRKSSDRTGKMFVNYKKLTKNKKLFKIQDTVKFRFKTLKICQTSPFELKF